MAEQLCFSRSLYTPEAVQTAVAAFEKLAEIQVEVTQTEVVVTLSRPHPRLADTLADELANHVLHHTVLAERAR